MRRYHVTTFGCQMNEHDSERIKGMLESLGYTEAETRADADLILFNTCSIREAADSRFVAHLGEAKRLKRQDPQRVVGVGTDHVLAHVLRVRAGVTDPVDAVHRVDLSQQVRERRALFARQVASVRVDVLAEQRHLADAVVSEGLHLGHELVRRSADLAATG